MPHPHVPEASDITLMSGVDQRCFHNMETPFHCNTKVCHQVMSALMGPLSHMLWWGKLLMACSTCSLLMNACPGWTTFVACWIRRRLVKLCTSVFIRNHQPLAWPSSARSRASFASGSHSCSRIVSTSMSRNVRHVLGPSNLDCSSGIPND